MPGSGVLTLSGTINGVPGGPQTVDVEWNLPSAVGEILTVSLTVGDTAISVPSGAATMCIIPPTDNAIPITMRTAIGDSGWPIHPQVPSFPSLGGTAPTVYLSIPALLAGPVTILFY